MTLSSQGICSECIVQVGINGGMIWAFKTRLNKMVQDLLHGWAPSDRQMHSGT